jgi:outer membrane immunogenic protein
MRVGWTWDRAWLYVTGGFAAARLESNVTIPVLGTFSDKRTAYGWVAGAGLEYAFWNNWSVKAEYLYYNLGRHSTIIGGSFTNFAPATGGFSTASVRDDGHILRAGLNYRFGWGVPAPVIARY